jgi:uncharacterized protein YlxW (UPF0749 family)
MTWATAVVLIVLISAIAGVMRSRSRTEGDRSHNGSRAEDMPVSDREQELQSEVVDLRERIKVLERIATDANSTESRETRAIADEIERLRDT